MIEINLLPKELQKKKRRIEIPKLKFTPIIFGIVALVVSIQLILTVTVAVKKHRLRVLEKRWSSIGPKKNELMKLNKQVNSLDAKVRHIETVRKDRILWARKLSDLSDSVIPGMWFTSLSLEETEGRKYLSIEGGISSFWKDETAMIGKFMKALKENKTFFKDFEEIQLDTMQQKKVKDTEVMSFAINCYFKEKGENRL